MGGGSSKKPVAAAPPQEEVSPLDTTVPPTTKVEQRPAAATDGLPPPQPDMKVVTTIPTTNEPPTATPTPTGVPTTEASTPIAAVAGFSFPPNTQPKDYFKTVHSAIRWQKPNIAEILEHPDTIDCLDEKTGNVPIHIAAQNGYMEIVRLLLDKSCAINALNKKGNTCTVCQLIPNFSFPPFPHIHPRQHHSPLSIISHPPSPTPPLRQFCDAYGDGL